jgi:hypothetical protein
MVMEYTDDDRDIGGFFYVCCCYCCGSYQLSLLSCILLFGCLATFFHKTHTRSFDTPISSQVWASLALMRQVSLLWRWPRRA